MEYFLMGTTVAAWIGCLLAIYVLRNGRYPALQGMRVLIWLYGALVTMIMLLDLVNEWRALAQQALLSLNQELLARRLVSRPIFAAAIWSFVGWLWWHERKTRR